MIHCKILNKFHFLRFFICDDVVFPNIYTPILPYIIFFIIYSAGTKSISNPITEDVTGVSNTDTPVRGELVIGISAIFILILVLLVVVLIIRFKRARDASRSKCTAPNNTKLNGDTTMTVGNNSNGNPYGTIQRHSATLRRPINNGFATLEQHPHNTLR